MGILLKSKFPGTSEGQLCNQAFLRIVVSGLLCSFTLLCTLNIAGCNGHLSSMTFPQLMESQFINSFVLKILSFLSSSDNTCHSLPYMMMISVCCGGSFSSTYFLNINVSYFVSSYFLCSWMSSDFINLLCIGDLKSRCLSQAADLYVPLPPE